MSKCDASNKTVWFKFKTFPEIYSASEIFWEKSFSWHNIQEKTGEKGEEKRAEKNDRERWREKWLENMVGERWRENMAGKYGGKIWWRKMAEQDG